MADKTKQQIKVGCFYMKITNRTLKKLIYFQVVYVLLINFGISELGFPSSALYLTDLVTILLLLFTYKRIVPIFKNLKFNFAIYSITFLSVVLLIGALINFVPILQVMWAIRNTYRFFAFFLVCVCVLNKDDVDKMFDILYKLLIINTILSLYQFFVLHKSQDYLGGIFGTTRGCNAMTNVFFCILLIYVLCSYLDKKVSIFRVLVVCSATLSIAALAELKVFFIEFAVIVILSLLFSKQSIKIFNVVIGSTIGLFVGLNLFSKVFPTRYSTLVNMSALNDYSTKVIWGYNISRLGAFKEINELFFKNDIIKNLLGYGFGNCEYSSFAILTSEFYNINGFYHYRWFAHQMWFLEGGYLGFGLFICFFLSIFIYANKQRKKIPEHLNYIAFTQVLAIITVINLWYNQAIRIEIAYVSFFALSIVVILVKDKFNLSIKGHKV